MSTRITFALILAAAVVPPGAANAPVTTPSEILANPDRFDGQVVTIEGTMTNLRQRVSRRGDPYYKFDLSDGKQAIRVFSLGRSPCRSGAVMVEGTFNKMKRGRRYTSYNVVNASRVICRQGSPGDEPGAGRDPRRCRNKSLSPAVVEVRVSHSGQRPDIGWSKGVVRDSAVPGSAHGEESPPGAASPSSAMGKIHAGVPASAVRGRSRVVHQFEIRG